MLSVVAKAPSRAATSVHSDALLDQGSRTALGNGGPRRLRDSRVSARGQTEGTAETTENGPQPAQEITELIAGEKERLRPTERTPVIELTGVILSFGGIEP